MMMAWPRMVLRLSTPSSFIHAMGVLPWRCTISLNSTTDCDVCTWYGRFTSSAKRLASFRSSGVHVSIWEGETKQRTRSPWAPSQR